MSSRASPHRIPGQIISATLNKFFSIPFRLKSYKMSKPTRTPVSTKGAPVPPPILSQGMVVGNMVYCSGQLGVDPTTGKMVEGTVQDRTVRETRSLICDIFSDMRTATNLTQPERRPRGCRVESPRRNQGQHLPHRYG